MKTTKIITISAALLCIVLLSTSPAPAVPMDPSYRGDPNSVHAIFEFTPSVGAGSSWTTTLFDSVASIYPLESFSPIAFDDGLDTTIQLPNFIDPLPLKLMRIVMFFDGPVPGGLIDGDLTAFDPLQTSWGVVGGSGPIDSSVHFLDIWIIPKPD